ncbi:hypothetical protein G9A89_020578 [Geosiphon pyriformis]|nr:hypothetical protein G9A89_020578 [Geosiphon pyriformis]
MPELINANPTVYATTKISRRVQTEFEENEDTIDDIDSQEIFDLIRSITDPEHPLTLEQLKVTQLEHVKVDNYNNQVLVEFTPTIPHCSMATLIGLCIRVRLLRSLPERFKVDIEVRKGTHQSELAVNKQLNDKERVAAALENVHLLEFKITIANMFKYKFDTLKVTYHSEFVLQVELNRPEKLNTFNPALWVDLKECFREIKHDSDVRSVVLSGAGKVFSAGLDLVSTSLSDLNFSVEDPARRSHRLRLELLVIFALPLFNFHTKSKLISFQPVQEFQDTFNAIESCDKAVIVIVHKWCIGAGVDLITACDIRYCTEDAIFSVKAIDVGLAADVGTLQRLPKVIGNDSFVREVCLTGRDFTSNEALNMGLVSKTFLNKEDALAAGFKTATLIAAKSPVATMGTKHLLNYSRDHSVAEGLRYTAVWNASMLNTKV